jgi:putative SOS response-associated peptidase YedK
MSGDTHPADTAPVIRWGHEGPELVEMRWGFEPRRGGEPVINVRGETADLTVQRCLVPVTELELFTGAKHPKRRWKVTLAREPIFFFAALWRGATAHWPRSYALLTIRAAPDLAALADRTPAVIRPADAGRWLSDPATASYLLEALPSGSYEVEAQERSVDR